MAKWFRVPGQLSWGQWLTIEVNFDSFFSLKFSKSLKFSWFFDLVPSCKLVQIWTFFSINLHWFKGPPVQFWSSCCLWFTYFPPTAHCATWYSIIYTQVAIQFEIKKNLQFTLRFQNLIRNVKFKELQICTTIYLNLNSLHV